MQYYFPSGGVKKIDDQHVAYIYIYINLEIFAWEWVDGIR